MNAFPERLKYFRSKIGLTQKELADKVGISAKQISDYEVGTSIPRQSTFNRLLKALNVSESEFLKAQFINFENSKSKSLSEDNLIIPVKNLSEGNFINVRASTLSRFCCDISQIEAIVFYSNILSPHVNDGDVILIDRSQKKIFDGKVYVIDVNQQLHLRIIHSNLSGQLVLSTNSQDIENEICDEGSFHIYGRVIYRQGFI